MVLAVILVPCSLPPWFARKTGKPRGGWGGVEFLGRTSPHRPLQPLGHPKLSHRPRPGSSRIPGVMSAAGGCQQGGGGRGDGYSCSLTSVRSRAQQLMSLCPRHAPLARPTIALGWLSPAARPAIDGWMLASQQSIPYSSTRLLASRWRSLFCEWHGLSEAVCACLATLRN